MVNAVPEDTFKILLATDNHLGYGGNDSVRDNDTYDTFEEILQIAVAEEVDFILLGGDLFHETRPSTYCTRKCIQLIKRYCMGDKPVEIEFLSDASLHFENATVNYEDPNINISIPIFSIHGNHDDPTGKTQTSAMEVLSSFNLINYFGRQDDVTKVTISPILLKKGNSLLALYGLSHVRDERLARLFEHQKVTIRTPEDVDAWFNLLVLHQNRANRGVKNFIAESFIPEFFDLAMWGHEHDCQIDPLHANCGYVAVTQPGSSVATSLSEGEALPKKVGILRVSGKKFDLRPVELRTVRPFVFRTITLGPIGRLEGKVTHADKAQASVKAEIEQMIDEAKLLGRREDMLPLIRLVVKYEDERQVFNPIKFGQDYVEKVANPQDILKFTSISRKATRGARRVMDNGDVVDGEDEDINRVEDLIPKYCGELQVLSLAGLSEAVKKFIDSNDFGAPADLIGNQEKYTLDKMMEMQPGEEDIDACIGRLRSARNVDDFRQILNDPNRNRTSTSGTDGNVDLIIDDDADEGSVASTGARSAQESGSRGRKVSGRGSRGSRKTRAK